MGLDGIEKTTGGLRIVFFGTYDTYRPRFRILREGLKRSGHHVIECHHTIWGRMEDRGRITTPFGFILPFVIWVFIMPVLIVRYLRLPPHDILVVPYLGQVDMIPARILASLRGVPLVFDPFISLYQTVVMDRRRYSKNHVAGILCLWLDRIAFRLADLVLCDTKTHAELYRRQLGIALHPVSIVPVGAESDMFEHTEKRVHKKRMNILFYGWMIPLHGVVTIIEAAAYLKNADTVMFTIIGTGQQYTEIRALARERGLVETIRWVESVAYEDLPRWIAEADICLGIFGTSDKADAVVPNKVYQAIASGRPVITGDTRAMREWFTDGIDCILTPCGDARALSNAIERISEEGTLRSTLARNGYELFRSTFHPDIVGKTATEALKTHIRI